MLRKGDKVNFRTLKHTPAKYKEVLKNWIEQYGHGPFTVDYATEKYDKSHNRVMFKEICGYWSSYWFTKQGG